jgi:Fe2+ or Zn2+ uptake regulation protein
MSTIKNYSQLHLKLTPQRIAILDYLEGNKSHPSAEDIYRAVAKQFRTMSKATVYNTLSALERRGQLLKLTIDPGTNYHLALPNTTFEITGNHVEFYGVCQKCRGSTRQNGK